MTLETTIEQANDLLSENETESDAAKHLAYQIQIGQNYLDNPNTDNSQADIFEAEIKRAMRRLAMQ